MSRTAIDIFLATHSEEQACSHVVAVVSSYVTATQTLRRDLNRDAPGDRPQESDGRWAVAVKKRSRTQAAEIESSESILHQRHYLEEESRRDSHYQKTK